MTWRYALAARAVTCATLFLSIAALGACAEETPADTCADGVKNRGETGVDCGGPCPHCLGEACSANGACLSGHCVDSICCDTSCEGACQACSASTKGEGEDGTCGPAAAGTNPRDACVAQGEASCGTDGACDGSGECRLYPAGTICSGADTYCSNDIQVDPGRCDGAGICSAGFDTPCAPYNCGSKKCKTTCATAGDCIAGHYCDATSACVPQQQDGAACGGAIECASGHCADGVCCNTACDFACVACTAAKKGSGADGACGTIAAGTDPDDDCIDDGATSCGQDGTCNGQGMCATYPAGTLCGTSSCMNGVQDNADMCAGPGMCVDAGTTPCGAYTCGAMSCRTMCMQPTDCVSGAYCSGSSTCLAKKGYGATCSNGYECMSGSCTGGIIGCICVSSVDCNALQYCATFCNAKKANGSACAADTECLSNRCNGNPLACEACVDSTGCLPSHYCNAGACVLRQQGGAACTAPDECMTNTCAGSPSACASCVNDSDCPSSHYCQAGSCIVTKGNGGVCVRDAQCVSGFCNPNLGVCN